MVDEATRKTLASIPLLRTKAGPRDKDAWVVRLKEEYQALIKVDSSGGFLGCCILEFKILFYFECMNAFLGVIEIHT